VVAALVGLPQSLPNYLDEPKMTPIHSSIQQVASVLRTQLTSLRAPIQKGKKGDQKQGPLSTNAPDDAAAPQDLAGVLAERVQQIPVDDPKYKRKVFRVFLDSIFTAEFGDSFATDLRFGEMIESVQQQMEVDPTLNAMVDEAVASLTNEKRQFKGK
jgi:hypothetical protein